MSRTCISYFSYRVLLLFCTSQIGSCEYLILFKLGPICMLYLSNAVVQVFYGFEIGSYLLFKYTSQIGSYLYFIFLKLSHICILYFSSLVLHVFHSSEIGFYSYELSPGVGPPCICTS